MPETDSKSTCITFKYHNLAKIFSHYFSLKVQNDNNNNKI